MTASFPLRSCVGCRARRPLSRLIRYERRSDGQVAVAYGRSHGRSAYTCARRGCFERAIKQRGFERAWRRAGKVVYDPASLWSEVVSMSQSAHLRLQSQGPKEPRRLRSYSSLFTELAPFRLCWSEGTGSYRSLRTSPAAARLRDAGQRRVATSIPGFMPHAAICGDVLAEEPTFSEKIGSVHEQYCDGPLGLSTQTGLRVPVMSAPTSPAFSSWGSRDTAAVARPTRRAT